MGTVKRPARHETIAEDFDSDIDGSMMSDDCNYNYDVINIKDETNPFFHAIKDVLEVHQERTKDIDEDEFDSVKLLKSRKTLAIEI